MAPIKTKEEAEAFLALIQLKRLWHEYTDSFVNEYFIYRIGLEYTANPSEWEVWSVNETDGYYIFTFPYKRLAQEFLDNFKEIFEKIKPLFYHK